MITYKNKDLFIGFGTSFWNYSIFILPENYILSDIEFIDLFYKLLPLIVTLLSMFLVYFLYVFNLKAFFALKSNVLFKKMYSFLNKKSAVMIKKLIESAVANAEYKKVIDVDNLFVKTITVDQGPVFKRFRPRAQGRASGVRKRMSHINVILGER